MGATLTIDLTDENALAVLTAAGLLAGGETAPAEKPAKASKAKPAKAADPEEDDDEEDEESEEYTEADLKKKSAKDLKKIAEDEFEIDTDGMKKPDLIEAILEEQGDDDEDSDDEDDDDDEDDEDEEDEEDDEPPAKKSKAKKGKK